MPGIHFITSINRINPDLLKQAGEEVLLKRNYEHTSLFSTSRTSLSFSGYDGYPCLYHEERDYIFLVEGLIYNIGDREIINRLKAIAEAKEIGSTPEKEIRDLIEQADGDFLAIIYNKKYDQTIIFNDRWGRLPAYIYNNGGSFIFSRELKFVLNMIPAITIDKIAVAEFLSLEYNFGDKTLFRDIKNLRPSSYISLANDNREINCNILPVIPLNFDRYGKSLSRKDAIRNSCELFYNAIKSRVEKADELKIALTADLSGGFDTRAVVGGLCHTGTEFIACSDDLITGEEFDYAGELADRLRLVLNNYIAEHPVDGLEELSSITYITDGTVNAYINTACFYDDLERQKDLPSPRMNFMGLGGEFMRNVYKRKLFYKNIPNMLIDDAFTHALSINTVTRLLKIERSQLLDNFTTEFKSLEEKTLDGQMRHLFFTYYHKAVNAGENRHRIFNWTIAPFWSNNLFGFLTQKVPHQINYDFYLRFLNMLDKNLLTVPFYPHSYCLKRFPMRFVFKFKKGIRAIIRDNRFLYKWARQIRGKNNDMDHEEYRYLIEELCTISEKSLLVKSCFDIDEIKKFAFENSNRYKFYHLLTVILYFYEIERRFSNKIMV
ncbi:MAG: hypothetical protein ABIJ45_04950 [Candidatus Zixiibacteriota bacterium]